jgi:hypothetical protein
MNSSTCSHPITSVVSSRTFTAKVKGKDVTFLEQKLKCVDCHEVCETSIT